MVLQDAHLSPTWLPSLELTIKQLSPTGHPNFRLWITAQSPMPRTILLSSVKAFIHEMTDYRALLSSSEALTTKEEEQKRKESPDFDKWVHRLCSFHAMVQSRKKYVSLGWNIPYEFSEHDLACAKEYCRIELARGSPHPEEVLSYMVSEVVYGGRVSDGNDRRLIKALLALALKDCAADSETASLGLLPSADSYCRLAESHAVFEALRKQAPSQAHISALVKAAQEQLPQPLCLETIQAKYPFCYEASLNNVLSQESQRYNRLITTIAQCLAELEQVLGGSLPRSNHFEEILSSLARNEVPASWMRKCYPTMLPLSGFLAGLRERVQFYRDWIAEGQPKAIKLSAVFFPQSIITATLQDHARKHKRPISGLAIRHQVTCIYSLDQLKEGPE